MVVCNGNCWNEKSIHAARYYNLNSKCSTCEIALNTDSLRCYCCSNKLRKQSSRAKNSVKAKQIMAQVRRY